MSYKTRQWGFSETTSQPADHHLTAVPAARDVESEAAAGCGLPPAAPPVALAPGLGGPRAEVAGRRSWSWSGWPSQLLVTRSLDPPAPAARVESSSRGPSRSSG